MVTPSSIINSKSDGIVKSEIVKSFDIKTDDRSSKMIKMVQVLWEATVPCLNETLESRQGRVTFLFHLVASSNFT